jgi:hypothetical protein
LVLDIQYQIKLCCLTDLQVLSIKSLIVIRQTEDSNLGEEANRYWREIIDQLYVFDIQEKEV